MTVPSRFARVGNLLGVWLHRTFDGRLSARSGVPDPGDGSRA